MSTLTDPRTDLSVTLPHPSWQVVCDLDQILPDAGVAVRVGHHPVAVFRLNDSRLLAVDHIDPFTDAPVLGRGIIGDHDGTPTVASPIGKQRFSLLDGHCLDDEHTSIATHAVRVSDGVVLVALSEPSALPH